MHTVLLVDDEPFALEGLELMIDWQSCGFQVEGSCTNGEEAIRYLQQSTPDLIVTDIRMPLMDGLELIRETRRLGNQSSMFVITSGYHDFEYARQAMQLGVSHYLLKPVIGPEVDEMLVAVGRQLEERSWRQLIRQTANQYALRQQFTLLLSREYAAVEMETELSMVQEWSDRHSMPHWSYLHIRTDAESAGQVRTLVSQFAATEHACHLVDDPQDADLFGLVKGWSSKEPKQVEELTERLRHRFGEALSDSVRLAMGSMVTDIAQLHQSWCSANHYAGLLFFDDVHTVHEREHEDQSMSFTKEALSAVTLIVELIENGDTERLQAELDSQFERFREERTVPELVSIFVTEAILRCVALHTELGGEEQQVLAAGELEHITCPHCRLGEIQQRLTDFCLRCQREIGLLQEAQTGGVQARVADFLRQHYTEGWTVRELAEKFYVHPVYLGQSFTRRYGVSILDFVHNLRIVEAERLLLDGSLTFCAIAEQIGYRSYSHFLKQFEKRTGCKPGDYCRLHGSETVREEP
ncbi:response regulator transcription factor [Paenibacillus kandeliae]|uniref:response regulator transcription factor n=1 Tax=Paenibacillus kandeliae TaxID=3231269 RepID=UPI00345756F0